MADGQVDEQPMIVIQAFDDTQCKLMSTILELEGYRYRVTESASETLALVDGDDGSSIVLMDNMQVSEEAQTFARLVFALPDLHRRVRIVGLMAWPNRDLFTIDCFIPLPITVAGLMEPIERLCAELRAIS